MKKKVKEATTRPKRRSSSSHHQASAVSPITVPLYDSPGIRGVGIVKTSSPCLLRFQQPPSSTSSSSLTDYIPTDRYGRVIRRNAKAGGAISPRTSSSPLSPLPRTSSPPLLGNSARCQIQRLSKTMFHSIRGRQR